MLRVQNLVSEARAASSVVHRARDLTAFATWAILPPLKFGQFANARFFPSRLLHKITLMILLFCFSLLFTAFCCQFCLRDTLKGRTTKSGTR